MTWPAHRSTGGHPCVSFEDWYRKELPDLILFATRLGARSEASDLVQNACAEAWARWMTIDDPRAYVRVVITRAYLKRRRDAREDLVSDILDSAAPADPMLNKIDFQDQEEMIFAAIRLLPPRQRTVMVWTIDGYTPEEISHILGIRHGTVRGNLHKARKSLKSSLASLREEHHDHG